MSTQTSTTAPDTIVFVHGLWMTPLSWEGWAARFEALGYRVITPAWPGFDQPVEALREDGTAIKGVGITDILDHYTAIIEALDSPPILIGHSFGGAFVQVLMSRGLGAAGVAVDSGTVRGIPDLPFSTIRSAFGVLGNPLNYGKAVPFSKGQFRYAFGNTLTPEASDAAWERYAVPAASKVLFQGAAANVLPNTPLKVDFKKDDRGPLLLIGGGRDHVVPAKVNEKNAKKYSGSKPITEFKAFPERSHFTVGEPGWEAVADFAIEWVQAQVGVPAGQTAQA